MEINEEDVVHTMEYYLAMKKELNLIFSNNHEGSRAYYGK